MYVLKIFSLWLINLFPQRFNRRRKKGRKEERKKGRQEGRKIGRKEDRKEGRQAGRKEGRKEGRQADVCGWVYVRYGCLYAFTYMCVHACIHLHTHIYHTCVCAHTFQFCLPRNFRGINTWVAMNTPGMWAPFLAERKQTFEKWLIPALGQGK